MLSTCVRVGLLGISALAFSVSHATAQEPFYKGKRLTVMVNFAPGGSTDIEGRLFARHIAKHIDGQPAVVVQNMDGAGGLNGTNFIGEIAPRDGTMVGPRSGRELGHPLPLRERVASRRRRRAG